MTTREFFAAADITHCESEPAQAVAARQRLLEILSKPTTFGESTQRVVTELLHAFSARLVAEFFDNLAVPGEQVEGMRQRDVLTAYIEGIDELRRAQFAEDAADAASAVNDDWDRRLGYVR